MLGGCVYRWGSASAESAYFAGKVTFGTHAAGHTKDDLVNSKLIILWGVNLTENIWGTNSSFHLMEAKEKGIRIIYVDPRFTNTAALFADQWIPIRPCTDTAMLIAMAYVIVRNNLQDDHFLKTYTIGFERFKDYLFGKEDGVEKTPGWAQAITGVQSQVTEKLAIEYCNGQTRGPDPILCPRKDSLWRAVSPGRSCSGCHDRKYRNSRRKPRVLRYSVRRYFSWAQYAFLPIADAHRSQSLRKGEYSGRESFEFCLPKPI